MLAVIAALALEAFSMPDPRPDVAAANAWLAELDGGHWSDSWSTAGTLFKSRMPENSWASTVESVRRPLGVVTSRSLKSVTKIASPSGGPSGEYEVVQFQTDFSHKSSATETLTLFKENVGWRVDGYFVR